MSRPVADYLRDLYMFRSLFHQGAYPGTIRAFDLEEILDWTEDCIARVDRASFFARQDMGDAVQYFAAKGLVVDVFEMAKDPAAAKALKSQAVVHERQAVMVKALNAALKPRCSTLRVSGSLSSVLFAESAD